MAPPQTNYSKHNIVIPDTPNTKMFRDLSRTDPSATKPFQKPGGFSGTSIDPAWRWMRLTEYFGPAGQGWGAEQLAFHFAEGMAFVCVRIWYRVPNPDGTMGTGEPCWTPPQWGGSELMKARKGYTFISDEALKMAMTDAMGKCAGMYLGLGADIYLGSFEDDKYREETETFYKIKGNPDLTAQAISKSEQEMMEKLSTIEDLDALDELWKSGVNARIKEIGTADKAAQQRMISAFSQKKNEIIRRDEQGGAEDSQPADQPAHDADLAEEHHEPPQTAPSPPKQTHKSEEEKRKEPYTADEIPTVEHWLKTKINNLPDVAQFDAFWDIHGAWRLTKMEKSDADAHLRLQAAYVARRKELGGGFKKVAQGA